MRQKNITGDLLFQQYIDFGSGSKNHFPLSFITMAEHIETNLLNSDLRYRFDYISKFLNFTTDDIRILNDLAKIVRPLIPTVVDTMYQKILNFNI